MTSTPRWHHPNPAHPGRAAAARSVIPVHAPVPGAGHPQRHDAHHCHNGRPDMKIKIRPDDTSRLRENDWLQTDGWLAELRDDGGADPAGDGHARPARGSDPWPEVLAEADARAQAEADARARAIGAGWRIDAFSRLACPRCQQTDPGFWATGPVVPWDRYTAVARAARAAGRGDGTAAWGSSGDPGRVAGGYPRVGPPEPGWHQ